MGIVPENEYLLGLEGAGVVRRVGKDVNSLKTGQRVLLHNKGTFANRLQVYPEKCHVIPDEVSFEVSRPLLKPLGSTLMAFPGRSHDAKCLPRDNPQSPASSKHSKGSSKSLPFPK
jgi:NADPH:quinone reductase-like Zn-dependent oxidoreductase